MDFRKHLEEKLKHRPGTRNTIDYQIRCLVSQYRSHLKNDLGIDRDEIDSISPIEIAEAFDHLGLRRFKRGFSFSTGKLWIIANELSELGVDTIKDALLEEADAKAKRKETPTQRQRLKRALDTLILCSL